MNRCKVLQIERGPADNTHGEAAGPPRTVRPVSSCQKNLDRVVHRRDPEMFSPKKTHTLRLPAASRKSMVRELRKCRWCGLCSVQTSAKAACRHSPRAN